MASPMRNIKLTIEYEGTNYHGWQIQQNALSIQQIIQDALSKITNSEVTLIGAGRTDAGVHALGQVANFHTDSSMPPDAFQKGLNSTLPKDIVILKAEEVDDTFHSRYSAISRVYHYTILNRDYPSAFARNLAYFVRRHLNVSNMAAMSEILVGTMDFSSFQRTGSSRENPICTMSEARCWREGDFVYLRFEADSFLRGMVRAIVGTILKLNQKPDAIAYLQEILDLRNRSAAASSAPARGLYLMEVKYLSHLCAIKS
ncbi:TPA: tRNA pseudouridine(38-40) synthase TruA [Candidatus Poribacteria bacterium]|nr:tRNA pseudouridine(38-40) synthase TruA [Candidatus Poribacteria bacterium]